MRIGGGLMKSGGVRTPPSRSTAVKKIFYTDENE